MLAVVLLLVIVACRLPVLRPATTSAVFVSVLEGDIIHVTIETGIERREPVALTKPRHGWPN